MVDIGIYTKNALIQVLAGINAGSTEKAIAATDVYVLAVEALIDVRTGHDWSSAFTAGNLDTTLRDVLSLTGAAGCAKIVVNANSSGYSSREWETHLDFLNSLYEEGIEWIKDKDGADMIKGDANAI